jgi:hypothetical protein
MRKFYPWYLPRMRLHPAAARHTLQLLQTAPTLAQARMILERPEHLLATAV